MMFLFMWEEQPQRQVRNITRKQENIHAIMLQTKGEPYVLAAVIEDNVYFTRIPDLP